MYRCTVCGHTANVAGQECGGQAEKGQFCNSKAPLCWASKQPYIQRCIFTDWLRLPDGMYHSRGMSLLHSVPSRISLFPQFCNEMICAFECHNYHNVIYNYLSIWLTTNIYLVRYHNVTHLHSLIYVQSLTPKATPPPVAQGRICEYPNVR